jgi:hypothetical protein
MSTAQMQFELRFNSLTGTGSTYSFPCDDSGRVDMDRLCDRDRLDYLFARGSIGYALASPAVIAITI